MMSLKNQKHVLTGAFGYTGRYLAHRLLEAGAEVATLTNKAVPADSSIAGAPFDFERPETMIEFMAGAEVFYNTYWVRFNHRNFTHHEAVRNIKTLFDCARRAGVRRIVHISITNPSLDSPWEYFRGKAELEEYLKSLDVSWAILRPAVLFGGQDILINNICWALRRLPAFGMFGRGDYRLRPIHVADLAGMMLEAGAPGDCFTQNAVGPESFTYKELVETLAHAMRLKRLVFPCPPRLAYWVGSLVGRLQHDVFITWPEIEGLMAGLLDAPAAPNQGQDQIRLTTWAAQNSLSLGRRYASELSRR